MSYSLRQYVRHRCLGLDGYLLSQWVFPALEYELNPLQTGIELLAGLSARCWRERIDIVGMDGFIGFKSIAAEVHHIARAGMDP